MRKLCISVAVAFLVVVIGAVITLYAVAPSLRATARKRTEAYLGRQFESSVQISDVGVSLYPRVRLVASGVILRHEGRTDIPPLLEVRLITLEAGLSTLLSGHPQVMSVRLDGLRINMPPRRQDGKPRLHGTRANLAEQYPILIHRIRADDALVVILRKESDKGKPPREFRIHQLEVSDFDFANPASFHALLTNPVPRGEIHCDGRFGPWEAEDPRRTPVDAQYTFRNADMGTLKGLTGTLSSDGRFKGPLDYIQVEGKTEVPDFALRTSDHPMALHTDFSAIVDGTNGDTILTKVVAKFRHTTLVTKGEVVDRNREVKGRSILMDTVSQNARIDDLLLLAVKSSPPAMAGSARLKARIEIPEGTEDLIERLKIDGQFGVGQAQFSSESIQEKINSLSRRGRGEPNTAGLGTALSELQGAFCVEKGLVTFSRLRFAVPGAAVALAGNYALDTGQMNFRGKLKLQAKLSQTTTGVKSFFLRALDPFFRAKDAGTVLPIKITGTKDSPVFGLDFHDKANRE
jgi:hypothetical protein